MAARHHVPAVVVSTLALLAAGGLPRLHDAAALGAVSAQAAPSDHPAAPDRTQRQKKRVDERLTAIGREAEALVAQERSLLDQLREFEVERAARAEEVALAEGESAQVVEELTRLSEEIAALETHLRRERPVVEQRLVALYKLGPLRSTRLLLDLPKARDIGRAYRGLQGAAGAEDRRFRAFERDRLTLVAKGQALAEQSVALDEARGRAQAARLELDRAIARQSAAIAAIDMRRDLSARLSQELSEARAALDRSVAGLGGSAPPPLPVEAFRGGFDWPATGPVLETFGRQRQRYLTQTQRNGIVIGTAPGTQAKAVHEGRVAFAAPFTGFGLLVIVDHGGQDFSLYGHLASLAVSKGDTVEPGSALGRSGTGTRGTPGLYFELRVDGSPVDPVEWLKRSQP